MGQGAGAADGHRRALAQEPKVHELIQAELDKANAKYAQVEQVKKFTILDHDLSQETGELTPTLKVKRNVVNEKYADLFDALYGADNRPRGRRTPLAMLAAMKTDPTDTGGLFVGRRPGTAPVRYRALPERGSESRQRDRSRPRGWACSR